MGLTFGVAMSKINDRGDNSQFERDDGVVTSENPNGVDAVTTRGGPIPPVPPGSAPAAVGAKTVPGRPVIAGVTGGTGSVSVAFYAPGDGGSAITGYVVRDDEQGKSATGTSSPITVTGLTAGKAHRFSVTAKNALGSGLTSAESQVVYPK